MTKENVDFNRRFGGIARLYGEKKLQIFNNTHICIIGLGGVGSWAAESFVRHGIGKVTLIDMDHIAESNINRQIQALHSTIGDSKIRIMAKRLKDINPEIFIKTIDDFLEPNNIEQYINSSFDFVIDAIDQTKVKIALAEFCTKKKISFLMTGGAGGKIDPSKIQIGTLDKTHGDPLLSGIRKYFNKQKKINGLAYKIPTIFSPETVIKPSIIEDNNHLEGLNCAGYGSSVNVTAAFGFFATAYVLKNLS